MLKFLGLRFVRYTVMTVAVTVLSYFLAVNFFNPAVQMMDVTGGAEVDPEVNYQRVQETLARLDLDPDQPWMSRCSRRSWTCCPRSR